MSQLTTVLSDWFSITDTFKRISAKLSEASRTRKTINTLNKLTDRELKDIGLHRGMIHTVANQVHTNPNLGGWV
mgnify:CR=1 FL=1